MHDDRRQVEDRIARLLRERLRPAVRAETVPLSLTAWPVPGEPVPVEQALDAGYTPIEPGTAWGAPWSTLWLRAAGEVPAAWAGRRVDAIVDLGFSGDWPGFQAEGLVFDATGRVIKGVEPGNRTVPVAAQAVGGEKVDLLIEAAANPQILVDHFAPTPLGDPATAGEAALYRLGRIELAVREDEVWHLVHDVEVLDDLMRALPGPDPRRQEILRGLEQALDHLDLDDVAGSASAVRAVLAPVLATPAHASAHTISVVGHAHIDTAWLWPVRETRRKAARTFANVVTLAAEYPELVFAGPQAQQYAWVREAHPEVFARVRDAVRAGTWTPVGGMWVEADGNLPGGEALVRQLVHGKRFFAEEFGVETRGVWLPDSFGYTAAYPQLALLAGNEWFLTQKISWNATNTFPHHTFWWEGIDGSRILTHFPPADTYNASLRGSELAHAVSRYAEKGVGFRSLLPFGHGDGGGGPSAEMLERARRTVNLEGSPRVRLETPDAFFEAVRGELAELGGEAPVWSGELYLELHRGTLTTQARTKAGNRRAEHLLREAELWASTAAVLAPGYAYPYDDLERLWRTVLLYQFHDILPGTSIAWVHRETEAVHAAVHDELARLVESAAAALSGPPSGDVRWLLNGGPFPVDDVPAGGIAVAPESPANGVPAVPGQGGGFVLDNGLVRVTVAADGTLASVRDLTADREVLAPGTAGNLLQLHPDLPNHWDAWDVDKHYRRVAREVLVVEVVEAVAGGVRVARSFGAAGASRIEQTVRLRPGSRRIDVRTVVDWNEREKFLKAAFALDVHADRAASEIQFGHVWRPTHENTSWDAARFEVCAHRWVYVGEPGYGVALLTDSTYGHDARRSTRPDGGTTTTVRLSLLRAPRSPDPDADQGRHEFCYALLPGATIADAVREGYALNLPIRPVPAGDRPVPAPLVTVTGDGGAVVEAVKLADDRSGDLVVRLYEALGGRARATLRLAASVPVVSAQIVDLLERPLASVASSWAAVSGSGLGAGDGRLDMAPDGGVAVTLRPFQVLTVRLELGR